MADQSSGCAHVPIACVTEFCSHRTCGGESIYDEQGCFRPTCQRESDCAKGEKCRSTTYNVVNCAERSDGKCECSFGLSLNSRSSCFPAAFVTPCAECDGAKLFCAKPGLWEAAEFPLTTFTPDACRSLAHPGGGTIEVRCATEELCNSGKCEKYTFDGTTMSTPSGLKCKITPSP